jgi:hypothetical protein
MSKSGAKSVQVIQPCKTYIGKQGLHFISMIIALLASVPGTAMAQSIPDGFYYKLSTEVRGAGMKLDVFNGGPKNNMTRLEQDQNVTGQFWRIKLIDGGWYQLSTQFRGSKMCLDINNGGANDNEPYLTPCGDLTGQHWKISGDNHMYRLTTEFRGPDMCLDIFNGGDNNNQPQLRPCSKVTGQAWTLMRTDTAVEGFVAEEKPGRAPAQAPASSCKRDEVYSSSMGQCVPKTLGQGRPAKSSSGCKLNEVYSSSMGQCIPKDEGSGTKVLIPHGCPYNLDKACIKTPAGTLVQCHCVS